MIGTASSLRRGALRGRQSVLGSWSFKKFSAASSLEKVPLFIDNELVESESNDWIELTNPATGEAIAKVPQATKHELESAVESSRKAFESWRYVSAPNRARVMFKLQALVRENLDDLAKTITLEQGKTFNDAKGDVFRGLEAIEHACSVTSLMMGETSENLSTNVDTYTYRQPLGVVAGLAPFNFPFMIPCGWMASTAIATGNAMVLKPSEKDPLTTIKFAKICKEAGLPPGILNVVHGTHDTVNFICDSPTIKAVSFVGSNKAGEYIYSRASGNGKRVQCNMGAKNHGTVLPDADKEMTLDALAGAAFGAAGQRCMALSVAVFVGESQNWIPELVEHAKKLNVGAGHIEGVDIGPVVDLDAKKRIESLIKSAEEEGASILLDGRGVEVEGYPNGYYVGPTIISDIDAKHTAYQEEIFGPVLNVVKVDTLDDAIEFTNQNPWGNGCAVFTQSGAAARKFQHEIDCGQVGINLPIPVPVSQFAFTGSRASIRGSSHFNGKSAINFYTSVKSVTSNWSFAKDQKKWGTSMPILGKK